MGLSIGTAVAAGIFGTAVAGTTGEQWLGTLASLGFGGAAGAGLGGFASETAAGLASGATTAIGSEGYSLVGGAFSDYAASGLTSGFGSAFSDATFGGALGSTFGGGLGSGFGSAGYSLLGDPSILGSSASDFASNMGSFTGFDPITGANIAAGTVGLGGGSNTNFFTDKSLGANLSTLQKAAKLGNSLMGGGGGGGGSSGGGGATTAGSLAQGAGAIAQAAGMGSNTAAAANAADPFAGQRGQYQVALANLMKDPSSLINTPGYQAGIDAITRAGAANGLLNSGGLDAALLQYGGNAFNQQATLLAQLAGAYSGSPAAAGQLMQSGAVNQTNLLGQGLNSLLYGVSGLKDMFSGGSSGSGLFSGIGDLFGGSSGGSGLSDYTSNIFNSSGADYSAAGLFDSGSNLDFYDF